MGTDLVLTSPQPDTMLTVIERAVMSPDFDVSKLKELLELRERYEAAEAKRAYVAAKARFAAMDIHVSRDKVNKQYDSRYTSLGNLVETVRPKLAACGFEARWTIKQSTDGKGITVACVLTHDQGHSEQVSMDVPPDASGSKNSIQQIKSAITYARNLTFEAVCGLASTDGTVNVDDDANSAGSNGDLGERIEWLANAKDLAELKRLFDEAYRKFAGNTGAQKSLIAAKDARKKELA